ncbi:MAG: AAA family ATPase [Ignavibacteriales bacterium]|nr:AAA family ATPase [Ignavibacteriales bacterium]
MAKVIAVALPKGGVGKTTTAVNLAASLAVAEQRTLLIDMDTFGASALSLGFNDGTIKAGLYEVFNFTTTLAHAIHRTDIPFLDFVPSDVHSLQSEDRLARLADNRTMLRNAMRGIVHQYDYRHPRLPPSSRGCARTLTAADSVLIPVKPGHFALDAVDKLFKYLDWVRDVANRTHRRRRDPSDDARAEHARHGHHAARTPGPLRSISSASASRRTTSSEGKLLRKAGGPLRHHLPRVVGVPRSRAADHRTLRASAGGRPAADDPSEVRRTALSEQTGRMRREFSVPYSQRGSCSVPPRARTRMRASRVLQTPRLLPTPFFSCTTPSGPISVTTPGPFPRAGSSPRRSANTAAPISTPASTSAQETLRDTVSSPPAPARSRGSGSSRPATERSSISGMPSSATPPRTLTSVHSRALSNGELPPNRPGWNGIPSTSSAPPERSASQRESSSPSAGDRNRIGTSPLRDPRREYEQG